MREVARRGRTGLVAALLALVTVTASAQAAAPEPTAVTPELIAAARGEGAVVFYTSIDLEVAEKIRQAFQVAYPGVPMQLERSGAERIFQRIGQERDAGIHNADAVEASDITHLLVWKRDGLLAPFIPAELAEKWPQDMRDPDGAYIVDHVSLSPIGYNTRLVKAEDAPRDFAGLLDPRWQGKIVKGHPGYSGLIMTSTFEISRDLGWDYFTKLARQRVLQVQSASEPPKKLAAGERAIMADGVEYVLLQLKQKGSPVEAVYPTEGTPAILAGAGLMKDAPHPNAGKLFLSFLCSRAAQQMMTDIVLMRSPHRDVTLPAGIKPMSEIKLMRPDPEAQEKAVETIKEKYASIFGL